MKEILDTRPLHPWRDRLDNLPEGKGDFYHWGPNYTVDPIVIAGGDTPAVLLILRSKDQQWALPGGFVDPEDVDDATAARRELAEETSLFISDDDPALIYRGPVNDPRSTQNAWPETTALLWRTDAQKPVVAGDDASDAQWFQLDALPDDLYGSHAELIARAINEHGTLHERLTYHRHDVDIVRPSGGHMGYDRRIVSLPGSGRVFVKHHTPEHFSDVAREQHSRDYLHKEFAVYRQLKSQTPHIANCLELIDDHTLVLEACDPRDGWYWRAPNDPSLQSRYIREVLAALREIEQALFEDDGVVTPAHHSFEREGWDNFEHARDDIVKLLDTNGATALRDSIDTLYADHQATRAEASDHFAHADLRQSNLAWHPEFGVRIVDWSWAGPSTAGLDTTSFIIDLAKSGIDTSAYMDRFEPHHARMLIGFWLGRAILPANNDSTVRQAQLASAIAAHKLLTRHR